MSERAHKTMERMRMALIEHIDAADLASQVGDLAGVQAALRAARATVGEPHEDGLKTSCPWCGAGTHWSMYETKTGARATASCGRNPTRSNRIGGLPIELMCGWIGEVQRLEGGGVRVVPESEERALITLGREMSQRSFEEACASIAERRAGREA